MSGRKGKGEGHIKKRSDGRWEARIYLADGRRKSFYAKTRAEVARLMREGLQNKDEGLAVLDHRQTLTKYLESWLETVKYQVRDSTWRRYSNHVRLHIIPQLGKISLTKLTAQQVQAFYMRSLSSGLSSSTVSSMHGTLHHALEDALVLGLVTRNITGLAKRPRMVHREMNVLSVDEVRVLLESVADDRFEGVYFLALTTAMREGEIFALRWQDIDLEQGTVQVRMGVQEVYIQGKKRFDIRETKTVYSRRKIGLTKATIEALKRHRARQEEESQALGEVWKNAHNLVFPNAVGGLMIPDNFVRRNYKRLLMKLGISSRVRFHDLRHTCATLLLSRGVNVKVVSEMLGHSDIGITLRVYAHVLPHMQQSAVQEMEAMLGWD